MLTRTSSGPGFWTVERFIGYGTSRWYRRGCTWDLLVVDRATGLLDDHCPLLVWDVLSHADLGRKGSKKRGKPVMMTI